MNALNSQNLLRTLTTLVGLTLLGFRFQQIIRYMDTLSQIDALIAAGRAEEAGTLLKKIASKKIDRSQLIRVGWQLVRCGIPLRAIQLLRPFVRESKKTNCNATDEEKALYAGSLAQIGANLEAIELLDQVSVKKVPAALLYRGFALVNEWNYRPAIPVFLEYMETRELTEYQRAVGQLNLAACYVHERHFERASSLLNSLYQEAEKKSWVRIRGNLHELFAQNAVNAKEWKEADRYIERAEMDLKDTGGPDAFFVRKWKAILEVQRSKGKGRSLELLEDLKQEATDRMHWETVRDCDRVRSVVTQDEKLYLHLCFGTPYSSFKGWLEKDFGRSVTVPEHFEWRLGPPSKAIPVLDLLSGALSNEKENLRLGRLNHRFLIALSRDFYRPLRVAPLHALVYPGEYFSPASAAHKLYEGIRSLRIWLKTKKIPLDIEENDGQYRLLSKKGCFLRVHRNSTVGNAQGTAIEKIRERWIGEPFTVNDIMGELEMTRRTAQRFLQTAVQSGALQKINQSAQTQYVVASKKAA